MIGGPSSFRREAEAVCRHNGLSRVLVLGDWPCDDTFRVDVVNMSFG
jgi:hypothetical protein